MFITKFFKWIDDNRHKPSFIIAIVAVFIICTLLSVEAYIMDAIKNNATYVPFSSVHESLLNKEIYSFYSEGDTYTYYFKYIKDVPEDCQQNIKDEVSLFSLGLDDWYKTEFIPYEDIKEQLSLTNTTVLYNKMPGTLTSIFFTICRILIVITGILFILVIYSSKFGADKLGASSYILTKNEETRFSDVLGHDEILADLKLYIKILKEPKSVDALGAEVPRGLLLSGPPGTGKTLIAKALAGEAGVPFIYLNTSNTIDRYVGVGARAIRLTFEKAREMSPCIVFLDEIDSIGRSRSTGSDSERIQTINALLQELDGFSTDKNVLVIAATNDAESLDSALLRSGRFDRKIVIAPPSTPLERESLLRHYIKKLYVDPSLNLVALAEQLSGFTGADIKALCNEAAVIALQKESPIVAECHFLEAMDRIVLKGNRRASAPEDEDQRIVAIHEAGHAIMCYLEESPVSRISIHGTSSGVGGFVVQSDKLSQFITKKELLSKIRIAYAGRASEELFSGGELVTSGAASDLSQATNLLLQYISKFGFSNLGMLDYAALVQHGFSSNSAIENELRELSLKMYAETLNCLKANYKVIEQLANLLLKKEDLTGAEFKLFMEEYLYEENNHS